MTSLLQRRPDVTAGTEAADSTDAMKDIEARCGRCDETRWAAPVNNPPFGYEPRTRRHRAGSATAEGPGVEWPRIPRRAPPTGASAPQHQTRAWAADFISRSRQATPTAG